ncbi:MAG: J domain-containing protein [Geobacteraceae bacterium]
MTYANLQEALRVLGLGERATLAEIKAQHRELVKRHHPDTRNAGDILLSFQSTVT